MLYIVYLFPSINYGLALSVIILLTNVNLHYC